MRTVVFVDADKEDVGLTGVTSNSSTSCSRTSKQEGYL